MSKDLIRSARGVTVLIAIIGIFLISGSALATTFYIAANGSDSNNGTSQSTPWLHAPGMPNCIANCAAYTPAAGDQFIFRGGDTWHFGNSSATPYTGGTWAWSTKWNGSLANCDTTDNGGSQTSCIYIGVDTSWYSGSSWVRPVMTGDNPTSTTAVSSCAYPEVGASNDFFQIQSYGVILDNFEWTGMCQQQAGTGRDRYIAELTGNSAIDQNLYRNNYIHGWTHVAFSCSTSSGEPEGVCYSIAAFCGSVNSTVEANVVDGADSDPSGGGAVMGGLASYLVFDNVFSYFSQIETGGCHVWHDNLWTNYYPTGDGEAHGNQFECVTDAPVSDSTGHSQGSITVNAFYNNVMAHNAPNNSTTGDVKALFHLEPGVSEYQFNNVIYDEGTANYWDYGTAAASSSTFVYLFNNTFDEPQAGAMNCVQWLTAIGNHIITESGTGFASGSCTLSGNVVMTHATAKTQGYMANGTGQTGNSGGVSCANDTIPCAPTAATNSTVGAGTNEYSTYCATLLASSDPLIVQAGVACQSGTTDACSYNTTNHTVTCPKITAVGRSISGSWDAGAYQFAQILPPTNLTAAPH